MEGARSRCPFLHPLVLTHPDVPPRKRAYTGRVTSEVITTECVLLLWNLFYAHACTGRMTSEGLPAGCQTVRLGREEGRGREEEEGGGEGGGVWGSGGVD